MGAWPDFFLAGGGLKRWPARPRSRRRPRRGRRVLRTPVPRIRAAHGKGRESSPGAMLAGNHPRQCRPIPPNPIRSYEIPLFPARSCQSPSLQNASLLVATARASDSQRQGAPLVEEDNDKPTVLALHEIAAGMVDETILSVLLWWVIDRTVGARVLTGGRGAGSGRGGAGHRSLPGVCHHAGDGRVSGGMPAPGRCGVG